MRAFLKTLTLSIIFCSLVGFSNNNIYQWEDGNKTSHFTDNPSSIPLKYRNKGSLTNIKSTPGRNNNKSIPKTQAPPKKNDEPSQVAEIEPSKEGSNPNDDTIKKEPQNPSPKLSDEERALITKTKNYLETDVMRFEKVLKHHPPTEEHKYFYIQPLVSGVTYKLKLAKKLEESTAIVLQPIAAYFRESAEFESELSMDSPDPEEEILKSQKHIVETIATYKEFIGKINNVI